MEFLSPVFCHIFIAFFFTFIKINFFKKSLRNIIRVSNSLDLDLDPNSVSPDMGPNCLQRLSIEDKRLC